MTIDDIDKTRVLLVRDNHLEMNGLPLNASQEVRTKGEGGGLSLSRTSSSPVSTALSECKVGKS